MLYRDFVKYVTETAEDLHNIYEYVGIRFENKERFIGEIIFDNSKDMLSIDDRRAFPAYGSAEYDSLPDLPGVSAYSAIKTEGWAELSLEEFGLEGLCNLYDTDFAYLIATNNSIFYGSDENEIIMPEPVVIDAIKIS